MSSARRPAELRLKLFGGPLITLDSAPLTGFVSRKVQALLCYLAISGQPHSRAELASLLWRDKDERAAFGSLRKALANLNQIAGVWLSIERQTAAFNRHSPHDLDVASFESLLKSSLAPAEPEGLRQAVALYQGEFLRGFDVPDAPAFEEWMLLERERLKDLALRALQALADYHEACREPAPGLEYASRLLAIDPWREETHRQVMRLLAQAGQRTAALAQFETCRRTLQAELGVEPAPETLALAERIRASAGNPPHNLPAPAAPIIGRERELAEIAGLLARPDCRLLSLVGLSGIGKTRLALEAARARLADFADGVFLAPLSALPGADWLTSAIVEALGLNVHQGGDLRQPLLHFLSDRQLLLVLDGFEHALDGAPLAARILEKAPGVKIMATSTERLRLQGEWLLPVTGLEAPAGQRLDEPEAYSAVQLFLQCAQRAAAGRRLSRTEMHSAARICQMVEGMPLAIELAAAWVRSIPCAEVASEIEKSRDFLAGEGRDAPERHRSIRAVFDYSWSLLSEAERSLFSRLAVFRGAFDRAALGAVAEAGLPALSALVDKSLLNPRPEGRYQVHDLLRQYAAEKLQAGGLSAQTRGRHLAYYLQLAEAADPQMHGPDQTAWLDRLEAEHDNLRAALEWALRHDSLAALNLAGALGLFWDLRGHFSEGRRWLEQALQLAPPANPDDAWRAAGCRALYWAGNIAKWQGDYRRAAELAQRNLQLCRETGDARCCAYALYLLGSVANKQGDLARAQQYLDESQALFRGAGARWGLAHALGTLGNIARAQGRHDQAAAFWQESYDLYRAVGDRRGLARTLNRMWHGPYRQGDLARAEALLGEALELFREIKHRDGVAIIQRHLGLVAQAQGNFGRARVLFQESHALFEALDDRDDQVYTNWYLGRLTFQEGELSGAQAWLERSLSLARETGSNNLLAWILLTLAAVARHQADYRTARVRLLNALELAQHSHEAEVLADVLDGWAALAVAQAEWERAAVLFGAAEAIRQRLNLSPAPVVRMDYQRSLAGLQAEMRPDALAQAWAHGRALPPEQAARYAAGET